MLMEGRQNVSESVSLSLSVFIHIHSFIFTQLLLALVLANKQPTNCLLRKRNEFFVGLPQILKDSLHMLSTFCIYFTSNNNQFKGLLHILFCVGISFFIRKSEWEINSRHFLGE
ncbi:hypothetical protein GPALN_005151 [Globodera pallida]|nr:hypothetical protein GPALN_005151 [Globodera pallida]